MLAGIENSVSFQMSLLLFVALVGYYIASRLNLPVVLGEIILGLLVGPSLLNLVTYKGFVEGLAQIGAVVLLFVVGTEFKFSSVYKFKYFIIALLGVIVPWVGGYYFAQYSSYDLKTSIFIGTALTATSIAITANVLREMGKLKTPAAEAIIGAAVIDDILGLLLLAISNQVVMGQVTLVDDFIILLKAVLFLVAGYLFSYYFLRDYLVRSDGHTLVKKHPEMIFIFVMMIAFLYALAAELVGLSAIVGAFLAGASMSDVRLKHSRDFREGAEYVNMIFAAIFFVSLGVLIDAHQADYHLVGFILALTVIAIVAKVIGCYLASRIQGMSNHDSLIIGFGMSPRGEVAMIVALIGLTENIISQPVYTSIIFMSLLTTIFTPIVLEKWLYRS